MEKVITYFGADSSVGTTMIAQTTAVALSEIKKRVLLIFASSNPLMDYIEIKAYSDRSIDELRPSLRSGQLSKEEILNVCLNQKSLTILPPIKDMTLIRYYKENDLNKIIELVSDDFDYIIIDGGTNIQYPLGISALLCSDKRYIVITQQEKTINRYKLLAETVLKPLNLSYNIILNKFDSNSISYSYKNVQSITGKQNILQIQYCENGWEAELNRETLVKYPKYKDCIKDMVKDIDVDYTVIEKSKSKLFLESWIANEYRQ
ncbi:MAG: hypothetical protein RR495_03800 [Anaerovoracaceae bacterium]